MNPFRFFQTRQTNNRPAAQKKAALNVESLEDRNMPSVSWLSSFQASRSDILSDKSKSSLNLLDGGQGADILFVKHDYVRFSDGIVRRVDADRGKVHETGDRAAGQYPGWLPPPAEVIEQNDLIVLRK